MNGIRRNPGQGYPGLSMFQCSESDTMVGSGYSPGFIKSWLLVNVQNARLY